MLFLLPVLFACSAPTPDSVGAPEEPVWARIAEEHGVEAWNAAERVQFTWTHDSSGTTRSYDWAPQAGTVTARLAPDTEPITLPSVDNGLAGLQLDAHKAFINDLYWLAFEFRAATDIAEREVVDTTDSPFGPVHGAYRVRYPSDLGHTPGDSYVVYLIDDEPIGWSYFPAGASEPRMSTTRAGWTDTGGARVATRFHKPDGTPFIHLSDVVVDPG